jgi:hypothetical protein
LVHRRFARPRSPWPGRLRRRERWLIDRLQDDEDALAIEALDLLVQVHGLAVNRTLQRRSYLDIDTFMSTRSLPRP